MTRSDRVLVVDDEPLVLDELCRTLGSGGYEAVGVESARAALDLAAGEQFDVLLTSLRAPDEDALQLVREFRRHSPDTVAMIIAESASVDSMWKAMQEGIYDFIIRPVGRADLAGRLAMVLKRRAEERERSLRRAVAAMFSLAERQLNSKSWKMLLFARHGPGQALAGDTAWLLASTEGTEPLEEGQASAATQELLDIVKAGLAVPKAAAGEECEMWEQGYSEGYEDGYCAAEKEFRVS